MVKKDNESIDILPSEFKDSFEFLVSENFTQDVSYQIKYKLLKRSQRRQAILIICMLILFLLSMIFMFLNQTTEAIDVSDMIQNSVIFRYKYIPIVLLSLCFVVIFKFTIRLKRRYM